MFYFPIIIFFTIFYYSITHKMIKRVYNLAIFTTIQLFVPLFTIVSYKVIYIFIFNLTTIYRKVLYILKSHSLKNRSMNILLKLSFVFNKGIHMDLNFFVMMCSFLGEPLF